MGSQVSHVTPPPPAATEKPAMQAGGISVSHGLIQQIEQTSQPPPPPPRPAPAAPVQQQLEPPHIVKAQTAYVESRRQERDAAWARLRAAEEHSTQQQNEEAAQAAKLDRQLERTQRSLASVADKPKTRAAECDETAQLLWGCMASKAPSECAEAMDAYETCVHRASRKR